MLQYNILFFKGQDVPNHSHPAGKIIKKKLLLVNSKSLNPTAEWRTITMAMKGQHLLVRTSCANCQESENTPKAKED